MNYQCIAICNRRDVGDFDLARLQHMRERRAKACASHRREVVARQKRSLIIAAITVILGIFLALSTGRMSAQATGADQASDTGYKYYANVSIQNGDTLWSIAEEYTDGSISSITECVKEIRDINNLGKFETIKSGDSVIVPYYSDVYMEQ